MPFFKKSKQIFPLSLINEMNLTLVFVLDIPAKKGMHLRLSGNSDYSVYENGDLIHYGPARAAIFEFRVDEIPLLEVKGGSRLLVMLPWYNCLTYTRVSEPPFFIAEVEDENNNVLFTSDDFACYRFTPRLQKVVRFSYQREFSEYYVLDEELCDSFKKPGSVINLPLVKCDQVSEGRFLSRNVLYSSFSVRLKFSLVERGTFKTDKNKKPYRDRYMSSDYLKIFPIESWERNPNDFVSTLSFYSNSKEGNDVRAGDFLTYEYQVSKTGFLHFEIEAKEDSIIHFAFDEIDTRSMGETTIGVLFYRNTTHNIISYELKKGVYSLFASEPYTAKYVRAIIEKGEVKVNKIEIIPFENPLASRFQFKGEDKDIETIVEAAKSSFAQNATDILMDCPSRERAGWLCDTYFSGRAENMITGFNLVERNFLENYAHYKNQGDQPLGMIPMCYPSDFADRGFIPNWPMFYILEIEKYLKRHDDKTLLLEAKEQLFDFYKWCERFINKEGLLENLDGVVFVEWSHANDIESTCGVNFPTNILYAAALKALGTMYHDSSLVEEAEHIRAIIKKMGFNGTFFVDNAIRKGEELALTSRVSETTEYYAFYFGVASKEEFPSLYKTMIEKLGPGRDYKKVLPDVFPSNMFIGDYMRLLVLLQNGEYQLAYKEVKSYFLSMALKTGTLWEFDSTYASLTHCFTSFAINIIVEIITGIKLISPKEKKVYLSMFQPLPVTDFSVDLPLEEGSMNVTSKKGVLRYSLPDGYRLIP